MKLGEQKMFKKTLLALALTGLAGTATAATVVDTNTATFSAEGIAQVTSLDLDAAVTSIDTNGATAGTPGSVVVTLGSTAYQVNDEMVFTFPNDKFAVGTDATLLIKDNAGTEVTTVVGTTAAYSGGNKVTFKLTAGAGATTPIDANSTVTLGGIVLDSANLKAGGVVTVAYNGVSNITSGQFDKGAAVQIAEAKTQLASTIEAGDRLGGTKVDVSKERKVFVGGGKTDSVKITAENNTSYSSAASVSKAVYTLMGDFSFLDTDADGKADYDLTSTAGTVVLADDMQSAKVEAASFATNTFSVEATDGTTVIPVQDFSATTALTYTIKDAAGLDTSVTKSYSMYAGSWALNGYTDTEVSFVPFGSDFAHAITVTNKGTVEGDITVELTANGMTESKTLGVVAKGKAVTNIGKEVTAFAQELGLTNTNGALKIIVDAPEGSIKTDVVYYSKKDADRVKTK